MNNILTLILLGFSVGLGNFAAAVAIGLSGVSKKLRTRIAIVFGLFETLMPIVGLLIGEKLASVFGGHANLIGGVLLILVGLYELLGSFKNKDKKEVKVSTGGWGKLLLAGLALSIDNLIIGFSLGTYHVSIVLATIIIGATSVIMALIGLELGSRLSSKAEEYSEILSGLILIAVGILVSLKII